MKWIGQEFLYGTVGLCQLCSVTVYSPSTTMAAKAQKAPKEAKADPSDKLAKANGAFDVNKMGDMSDYDPATWVGPTSGDTIKIALVASFSGPAVINGQLLLDRRLLGRP
jgi:hypothetical protein